MQTRNQTRPAASSLAPKLKALQQALPAEEIHIGSPYLYLYSEAMAMPYTITENDGTLILSGYKVGQLLHRFTNVDHCVDVLVNSIL